MSETGLMAEADPAPRAARGRRGRGGGRDGNARRGGPAIRQMDWQQNIILDPPTEPIDAEGVARIHDTAMRVLEEVGIEILNAEARAVFKAHGADV
ncbi:MAG: trimethylamine methyltransferase family protein, partial [Pseudomonadota bacterium]